MSQHSQDAHHQDELHKRLPYNDDDSRADTVAALSLVVIAVLAVLYFVSGL